MGRSSEGRVRAVVFEAVEMSLEACDESGVSGNLAVPAALHGVVAKGLGVGKLILELRQELGAGLVVVAVLADVGVGAGFGREVAGAVAVRNSGLDHFAVQPGDPVGDDRAPGDDAG